MRVLGISSGFHDAAAAVVVDGQPVAAAQEERFSRTKHDARLPVEAIGACLAEAGLTLGDIDHVVYYEKPYRKFERLLETSLHTFPRGLFQFVRAMRSWLGGRLWLRSQLKARLGLRSDQLLFSDHHLSHAAAAFLPSRFASAAVITMDGVGERTTTAVYHGVTDADGTRLEPIAELAFPHSMGLLYSALTAYLGFTVNNGEYKVMGLASYGEPRFRDAFETLVRVDDDAALTLDMRYFCFDRHTSKSFTPALEALLGPARAPDSPLDPTGSDAESRRFMDIAATLQAVCEAWVLRLAAHARQLTGEVNVCLAGGVALNCVANGRLSREAPGGVYVHPAAGDDGGALGAALYASCVVGGDPRPAKAVSACLGGGWTSDEVGGFLRDCRVRHHAFEDDDVLAAEVARRLARGEVGAIYRGRAEWGPRALGARSILADPRDAKMVGRLNAAVKFREPFRPFAPAALSDEAHRWFALEGTDSSLTARMLATVAMTPEGAQRLPAITHVDGTARVQTVDAADQPDFARILRAFRAETGVGVLLNTSLNLRGEPICQTPGEAYSVFDRSDLDFIVLDRCLVTQRTHAGAATAAAA